MSIGTISEQREKKMIIDVRSKESVYITINGTVYYIDDSTGECIMQKWKKKKNTK